MSNSSIILAASLLLTVAALATAQETQTVIGPRNIYLHDGANELTAGDAREGVRLTMRGLEHAQGFREEKTAHSNLCAGFLLVDQPEQALAHCDWVIERDPKHWRTYNNRALVYMALERFAEAEVDIRLGQELRPNSTKLKIVKGMYLDETQPVTPKVETDDRRNTIEEPGKKSNSNVGD